MLLESPVIAALNHLLEAEPWARERLAPFSAETLELRAPPLPALRFAIAPDGRLQPAARGAQPVLVVSIGPDALPAAARGEDFLLRAIQVSGNAKLANEVLFLFRHLRWDLEEDLSRLLGDAAAHRLTRLARQIAGWHAEAARRLAENLVEYALEEGRLLVPRGELEALAAALARLRDDLERLEQRLERFAGPR